MFRRIFYLISFYCCLFCGHLIQAQVPSSQILNDLHKLNTVGTVLYIAAHPDDENTRLLSYLANERHVRTVYLSLTRGDGGQNLIGSEQGDMLGVIRTEELLAARRTDGAEQWFTRAVDFGYSKNPDETFTHWDKKTILGDVVYAIRKFRPDVIICRFPTTGEGGHGHHTASALLAVEAFDLASDPNAYPEQFSSVQVWQPKRIFWNTFNFGGNNTTAPEQLKIDVGSYNSMLGKSYGEIAAESRSNHKSQGFGSSAQRGSIIEYFKWLKGVPVQNDIFDGVDLKWSRFSELAKLNKPLDAIIKKFNPAHPELSLKPLVAIYKQLKSLQANADAKFYIDLKLKAIENLVQSCAGLWMETISKELQLVPGGGDQLTAQIVMRNPANIQLNSINFIDQDTLCSGNLQLNQMLKFTRKISVPTNIYFSDPYWLREPHENSMHAVNSYEMLGKPQSMATLYSNYKCTIEGVEFSFDIPVSYKTTDPVKGEYYIPLEVLPPITITPKQNVLLVNDSLAHSLFFLVKSNVDDFEGTLNLKSTKKLNFTFISPSFHLTKKGQEILLEVRVKVKSAEYMGSILAYIVSEGNEYNLGIQRINYDHIPHRFILTSQEVSIIKTDIQLAGKRIGYIEGAGDAVAECLKGLGYEVTELSNDLILNSDLSIYDAIVCGVRAFNTNEQLYLCHDKLMQYVQAGGRLVVQYNTNSRVGPINAGIGPYKFTISRNRVTVEEAPVTFLNDSARLLNYPNKITSKDFDSWIQERGIYFATDLDSNYHTLFQMNDPGEKPLDGSLIYAQYGNGTFIYTGLAFFRELPAGVPGAYRLFINLISR
ncbi:MAG: PIG-L family deacetylase [Bacteroidia bacterium]|nr:PIG-L family deacetylase [Bacteroidia bacterium]